jgi:hypothetical protein
MPLAACRHRGFTDKRPAMSALPKNLPPLPGHLLKALQASGVSLRPAADGSLEAAADRVELRHLVLHTPLGTVELAHATLAHVVVRLGAAPAGGSPPLLGIRADELVVEAAECVPIAPPPRAAAEPGSDDALRLEPLGTVQGRLQMFIRDARWSLDAEITLPVVAGRVDFDRVVVAHVGPNSSMGVAAQGIYVEAPHRGRTELVRFAAPDLPGVRYEQRGGFIGRVQDRGSVDLRAFVEAVLDAGAGGPVGRPAGGDTGTMLMRTKLSGHLQLADGAVGTARDHVVLDGRGNGRNGVSLTAAVVGQRLVLKIPEAAASHAAFEWQACAGSTGPIAAAVEAHVTGLAGASPHVTVKLHRLTVRGLKWGQMPET